MSKKRAELSCASLNGDLYVLGGFDGIELACVEKYNFTTKQWTILGNMECQRSDFTACVFESKILAIGGLDGRATTNHVEVYDETQDRWTKCQNMTVKRSGIAGVVVSGRHLGREVLQSFQHPFRDEEHDSQVCTCCVHPTVSSEEEESSEDWDMDMTSSGSDESMDDDDFIDFV